MITNTRKEIYRAATGAKKTLVKDLKKKDSSQNLIPFFEWTINVYQFILGSFEYFFSVKKLRRIST